MFTDFPKPDHMVCTPVIAALAFCGHQKFVLPFSLHALRSPALVWYAEVNFCGA